MLSVNSSEEGPLPDESTPGAIGSGEIGMEEFKPDPIFPMPPKDVEENAENANEGRPLIQPATLYGRLRAEVMGRWRRMKESPKWRRVGKIIGWTFAFWMAANIAVGVSSGGGFYFIIDSDVTISHDVIELSKPGTWCTNITLGKAVDRHLITLQLEHALWDPNISMCAGVCTNKGIRDLGCSSDNTVLAIDEKAIYIPYYSPGLLSITLDNSAPIGEMIWGNVSDTYPKLSTPTAYTLLALFYLPIIFFGLMMILVGLTIALVTILAFILGSRAFSRWCYNNMGRGEIR